MSRESTKGTYLWHPSDGAQGHWALLPDGLRLIADGLGPRFGDESGPSVRPLRWWRQILWRVVGPVIPLVQAPEPHFVGRHGVPILPILEGVRVVKDEGFLEVLCGALRLGRGLHLKAFKDFELDAKASAAWVIANHNNTHTHTHTKKKSSQFLSGERIGERIGEELGSPDCKGVHLQNPSEHVSVSVKVRFQRNGGAVPLGNDALEQGLVDDCG